MRNLIAQFGLFAALALIAWPLYHWYTLNWSFELNLRECIHIAMLGAGVIWLYFRTLAS